MKEIRMPYEEHEEMLETIKKQNKVIKSLKKKDNIVLLSKYDYHFGFSVPHIQYEGENEVIKELKARCELAEEGLRGLRLSFNEENARRHIEKIRTNMKSALRRENKCSWW